MSADDTSHPDLRGYIESSPDAIVIADPEAASIVEASEAAETFFGYSQAELRTMSVLDLHPPDERDRYRQLFEDHLENQPAVVSQFDDGDQVFVQTADDRRVPVEINAWTIDHDGRDSSLFQGIFRDVSGRLRRRRALQRQNERLEEFATVIAHDLRNPLNVARGRAVLLAEEGDGEHLEPLQSALDRIETIVDDTLTLARNGKRVGDLEPVNAVDAIGECWRSIETDDASLEIDDEFTIAADPDRLRHVFENLLRNAVQHGGDGVTVSVGRADERTMYVEDDGVGVPDGERDDVFAFGHSSRPDGTGMGLTIVRRLADAHGWTVSVTESDEGGARFEFGDVDIE
ncbi:PAS/PAC sensor signal transduction histidine kinase [Salinarchaeum sp. Harcht-Bsk1]|uniref:sensor histidine kinase n=1 Tax=Salinarchaeum sp. Harcht-Bsk1 TaxID=1333523 RepID=UPI00034236B1|nr:PAS domain-containing sensor histidine kinase [Salinarchaeum sp. Harcht-Bsk1]AGN00261.1 PAS/PAC sensor signal transduction histidine kinase [Salinarchaeum sp. Harcht-Bsk1]